MHMRKKKWARPELAACPFYTENGEALRGKWRGCFARPERELHVELGCGKGVSTAQMVRDNPETNYVMADLSADVLGCARRNLTEACGEHPDNAMILQTDICFIRTVFAPEDRVDRIYIHFCNPWTEHPKHEKRRLTHPRQLMQYRSFLKDGGEIWFKTDDDTLFGDSLVYFDLCAFTPVYLSGDLHRDGFTPNWISEHEAMYLAEGVPIKCAVLRKDPLPGEETMDFTRWRITPGVRKKALERIASEAGKPQLFQPQKA